MGREHADKIGEAGNLRQRLQGAALSRRDIRIRSQAFDYVLRVRDLLQEQQRVASVIVNVLRMPDGDHAHPLLDRLLTHVSWRGAGKLGRNDDIGGDHADDHANKNE